MQEVSTEERLRRENRRLKSELGERTEELEGNWQRAKDLNVFLERENLERVRYALTTVDYGAHAYSNPSLNDSLQDETIRWLKDKIEAMEKGREIPPPPAILFVPTSEVTMLPKVREERGGL